jgi:hypothetical protein
MAKWKALPGELDPAVVEFVGQLRWAKDTSGLSLSRLAALTGYSSSSWERYLGGRTLAPSEAVRAFAGATGCDAPRLLALQEAAAGAWRKARTEQAPAKAAGSGGEAAEAERPAEAEDPAETGHPAGKERPVEAEHAAETEEAAPRPAGATTPAVDHPAAARPAPGGARYRRRHLALTGAVSAAAGALLALLADQLVGGGHTAAAATVPRPVAYHCAFARVHGQWFAGNSTTTTDPLVVDKSGPDVAELQCLPQHAGFSPGGVDGNFGPLTEAAVIAAQKADHLDVDGQVGPRTWTALRG